MRLKEVVSRVGNRFEYLYDFGDSWRHDLRLEAIVLPDPETSYPRCLAGERRAPPEDVGGSPGYEDYLEAMADPALRSGVDIATIALWLGPESIEATHGYVEKVWPPRRRH